MIKLKPGLAGILVEELVKKKKASVNFTAKGPSMFPSIKPGDIITVKSVSFSKIKIGDIIVFKIVRKKFLFFDKKIVFIVHRVIKKNKDYIITKGDFAVNYDRPLKKENIIGKVIKIKKRKNNGTCRKIN